MLLNVFEWPAVSLAAPPSAGRTHSLFEPKDPACWSIPVDLGRYVRRSRADLRAYSIRRRLVPSTNGAARATRQRRAERRRKWVACSKPTIRSASRFAPTAGRGRTGGRCSRASLRTARWCAPARTNAGTGDSRHASEFSHKRAARLSSTLQWSRSGGRPARGAEGKQCTTS